jgi:DNA (cytosine-5)-methyltransferase 1
VLTIGELCAGYGGLGLGIKTVLDAEIAWVSEISPGASMVLAHRFPDVPNVGDLTTAPWGAIKPVDILAAGFPCQPVSHAGLKKAMDDERWLWDDIVAAVRRMDPRPRLLVLENVAGLLSAGSGSAMGSVIHGLAALGYVGRYRVLRASDVGAPHRRERVFVVAADAQVGARDGGQPGFGGWAAERRVAGPVDAGGGGGAPADAELAGLEGLAGEGVAGERRASGVTAGGGGGAGWGPYAAAISAWERVLGRAAPWPAEPGRLGKPRLSCRFVEWMMGLPDGWVTAVPGLSRREQLTALGNGVVPQQAALALQLLLPAAVMV